MGKIKTTITGYGYDGEGVGRVDGKVVFVPYTLRDEVVEAEIEMSKSSFCKGKLSQVCVASKDRTTPPCQYFSRCGGCAFQHTDYDNELNIKLEVLKSHLAKIGFDQKVDIISSQKQYGYRNKIKLFVGKDGLSLKERGSDNLVAIKKCMLVEDKINEAIDKIQTFLKSTKSCTDYSQVVIRKEANALLVNFYKTNEKLKNYQGLYLMLGSTCGIFETFKSKTEHMIGLHEIECDEFGLECSFSARSFHQVNEGVEERLYDDVINNILGNNIINCYSGAGVLSGMIAKQGKRVVGIELGEYEHQNAQEMKEKNNLFYLTNYLGDCGKVLPKLTGEFDTIIVDPPRAGLGKEVVSALNSMNFKRLIYVSCNSATCVRDIQRLNGFKLQKVSMYDMFSRTSEFEIMAVLDKE